MRKLLFCALAVACGAEVADAQEGSGYAFRNAGQQWTGAFGSAGGSPSWGMQGYAPYYPAANYYPYAAYPAYPVNMVPDYSNNFAPDAGVAPAAPSMMGDATAAMPALPNQDPAGLMPGMPLPKSAYAANDDPDRGGSDEAFHRPCNDRFWASLGYTMGWFQAQHVAAPLATTGSPLDPHPGAVGQQGTVVLFGANPIDPGMYSGLRAEVGVFLDDSDRFSLEFCGLYLFPNHSTFSQTSDASGNPVLARPVFNIVAGRPTAFVDSLPGVAAGGFNIDARSDFIGTEFNASCHAYGNKCCHVEGLLGFRYMHLGESLTIQDQLRPLIDNALTFEGMPVNAGTSLTDMDSFRTANDFYGLQVGGRFSYEGESFFISPFAKIAIGATDQTADINGSTTFVTPAGNQTALGGLLALSTNIGHHSQTVLGFAPEAGINAGVNITKHIQLVAGYSFLFWDSVVRPGNQIDPAVNPSRIPSDTSFGQVTGAGRPLFSFHDESFWLQQINIGIQIHY